MFACLAMHACCWRLSAAFMHKQLCNAHSMLAYWRLHAFDAGVVRLIASESALQSVEKCCDSLLLVLKQA